MIVTGIQFDIAWEDPKDNFRRCTPLLEGAARDGADLLVLPEMFATGFSMRSREAAEHAEQIRDFLARAAKRLGCWILGGLVEPFNPKPRNACILLDREGKEAARYRKLHPFTLAGEPDHFAAGDELIVARVEDLRICPFICYDLRFPEPFRAAAGSVDLFVVPANWPVDRIFAWKTLLAARAVENLCYVIGVNRVGEGDGKRYPGESALIDPLGETVSCAGGKVACFGGAADPAQVARIRRSFSFLADRRPELYRRFEMQSF